MKRLQALVLTAVLVAASHAFAVEKPAVRPEGKEMTFDEKKENALSMLDKRISRLQEHRKCVQDAKNKEDIGKCREAFKEEREETREHRRDK